MLGGGVPDTLTFNFDVFAKSSKNTCTVDCVSYTRAVAVTFTKNPPINTSHILLPMGMTLAVCKATFTISRSTVLIGGAYHVWLEMKNTSSGAMDSVVVNFKPRLQLKLLALKPPTTTMVLLSRGVMLWPILPCVSGVVLVQACVCVVCVLCVCVVGLVDEERGGG